MKIKSFILTLIILLFGTIQAQAAQLPKELKDFLLTQKKVPVVRADGVVVYNNDIMYLPVFPAYKENVDTLKIVKTYPANQKIESLPDMILFNNNFSLLKVYRVNSDTLTVRNIPDLPIELKTGSIAQDIMVPRGLVLPENLAGILGDVQIPIVGSAKTATFVTSKKRAPLPTGKKIADDNQYKNIVSDMKNKLFFVNNFQTEYLQVFSSTVSEPLYSLKTSGVMKDVKPVLNGKYLLAATKGKKNIDVIDIDKEYVSKYIDLTAIPSEIIVDDLRGKAYVSSIDDESLSVIDLASMSVKEKIQLVGSPQKLSVSSDGTKIAYSDLKTSNIYVLDLQNDYENKLITNYPNVSKLILDGNYIYLIARTAPVLRIVNFDLLQDNKTTKTKKDKNRKKQSNDAVKNQTTDEMTNDIYYSFDFDNMEDDVQEGELVQNAKTYSTSIKDVAVGAKPIDMTLYNNSVYVLCAGNNTVYNYHKASNSVSNVKLPVDGFSKSFTPVPNSNLAVVTNMSDLKYVVFDMEKEKTLQTLPINEYINTITILERN